MVYIILAAVAVICFLFCVFMLVKVERVDPERHKPAWQDEDADEETEKISYRSSRRIRGVEDKSTPWRYDPPEDEDEEDEDEEEEEEEVFDLDKRRKDRSATKKFYPVTKDEPQEKEDAAATKKFSPVTKDAPAPKKRKKSKLLKTLEICCGILFAIVIILLIIDIYIHSL